MADVRGSNTRVILVPESSYKTPGSSGERLYFTSFGAKPDQQRDQSQTIGGFRGQARSAEGLRNVGGPVGYELAPESVGLLLKHLIGAPTTTGANAPYSHVFQAAANGANALPVGFTVEEDFGTAINAASRYLQLRGMRIGSGSFSFRPSGFQTAQFDLVGADWLKTNTTLDAAPTDNGHTPFTAANLSVRLGPGGSPLTVCFNELNLNWSNDLDTDKFCLNGGGIRAGLAEGFAIVDGSVTAFFDHEDLIDTILGGADTSLEIKLSRGTGVGTAGNESLTIAVPNLVFARTGPTIDGPKGLRLQANFNAHRTTGELGVTATLLSPIATLT